MPCPSLRRCFPLQIFNLSLLTSDFYAFGARGIFFEGFSRHSLTVFLISCAAIICGLVAYFTAPDPAPDLPRHASTSAPPYAPVDPYDVYSSADGQQASPPGDTPCGLRAALSLSGGDSICERASERGAGETSTNDYEACVLHGSRMGDTGSSPRGCAMLCSPAVGSAAQVVARERSRSGGGVSGLEMASSDGQAAWERGEGVADGGVGAAGSWQSSTGGCEGTLDES